ncbi:MAG: MiaB/RimO family radical SAM methylthiotransferase [Gemmatimonadaceae bacterium]
MNVYLRTFGCRANQYDTEAVRALVESNGHTVVETIDAADAAVFNSCAVTSSAEAELRKVVRRAARERPGLKSVVMGCAAALDDARPAARQLRTLPTVHDVVGGADLLGIAKALDLDPVAGGLRTRHQSGTRALLRIQDGCDEHCTFCATTLARGANRSRPIDELVREAQSLAHGHTEIVITGIHIGTYGTDIGSSLGELMARLMHDVPAVRFRLSSIEATELDTRLVALLVGEPRRLAPHLHAPLQSGSDRLLKRMGRNWYTSATYSTAIERIAGGMSILGLGADIIAGFPGETSDDHRATLALVEALPFTYLHVFPYSVRPGTAAERLPDHVSGAVAGDRAAELRALGAAKAAAYVAARVGGTADTIVVGGPHERDGMTGDYLSAVPADETLPRGARFMARLAIDRGRLMAHSIIND